MYRLLIISILIFNLLSCHQPKARRPITIKSGLDINTSIQVNKRIQNRDVNWIKQIIKNDSLNTYLNSGNGFWYSYKIKDTIQSYKPRLGDIVNFNYNIKSLDGKTIYSKEELKTKSYRIDKEELFFGLREGLKLLQAGESAIFLFPSHVAYGFYGDLEKIGQNIPLISEVTVNSVTKENN